MEQCLQSVCRASEGKDVEIIVVDNHSTDGSNNFFAGRFPDVNFIWKTENVGFAKANNQALAISKGVFILFLNPDTLVPEDCFDQCIDFIRSKENRCAIGVKMVDGSGNFLKESRRSFPGPLTSLYKLSGLAALFPRSPVFARYYLGHLDKNTSHETDVLAGAFMMAPRQILSEVNGFDESFFMYGEDIDLSFRIQKAGYSNYYFAGSTIIHFKGESTKKGSLNYVRMFYKAMSVFVKKHYGGSRAGIFNVFIQTGIGLRAALSALSRFVKWIGLPVLDALLILLSFWIVKAVWAATLRTYIDFDPKMLWIAFPAFTALFMLTSYYSGLYDNGYRQSRLNRATLISALVLFTVYSLLPLNAQFSRGILLFSILLGYLLISLLRIILCSVGIITRKKINDTPAIAIIGTEKEYETVLNIIKSSGHAELVLGRISVNNDDEKDTLGNRNDLEKILQTSILKNIVFCQGALTFKGIIDNVQQLPNSVDASFYAEGSRSIIESKDEYSAGRHLSSGEYYRLQNPLYQRAKRLFDICVSILFLLTFPIHLLLKKKPGTFYKQIFSVLFNKKSFVGYAETQSHLPTIKPGILTTTGLPAVKNTLPPSALIQSDGMYARHYSVFTDFGIVWNNYQLLS